MEGAMRGYDRWKLRSDLDDRVDEFEDSVRDFFDLCPTCGGSGMIQELSDELGYYAGKPAACPDCDGTGDA
jgi:DnaJ-class molecular chaperone